MLDSAPTQNSVVKCKMLAAAPSIAQVIENSKPLWEYKKLFNLNKAENT